MKKTTLRDVAKMAGVSVSTASRVLTDSGTISPETCALVKNAAHMLNYTPNTAARSLRCDRSRSIGVVFPNISGEFYAECASAILRHARIDDYAVLFTESGHNKSYENDGIRALMDRCVDGIIFIGDNKDSDIILDIQNRSIPVVTGDRRVDGVPYVTFNNRHTVSSLVQGLYSAGCRRFVYLGEPTEGQDNLSERYGGYRQAIDTFNDAVGYEIFDARLHEDKPGAAFSIFTERIADIKPDAVVTSNDLIAHGIISAAYANNISIPRDISVTGFDDTPSSAYFIPSVTTVRQDTDALAESCFCMLKSMIDGNGAQPRVLKQELIIRQSAPCKVK